MYAIHTLSRSNPFNNLVRDIEMKSTDKFVLVLVASLALLLAGCGGGGSSTAPPADVPSQADMAITDAQAALMAAEAAVTGAMTDDAKLAAYRKVQRAADNLVMALTTHGGSDAEIAAAASKSGNAEVMADTLAQQIEDDAMAADMAMMETAAKLYAGISAKIGSVSSSTLNRRAAAYHIDDPILQVAIGTPVVNLSEDKKTMVAANHGWEGARWVDPAGGDMVEAYVYSNVGEPTQGAKFNSGDGAGNVGFATIAGVLTLAEATNLATRIASPSFDHTAGTKTFKLPESNPQGETIITIPGSYYGVSGMYSCDPAVDDDGCRVNRASNGYTLALTGTGGGTWTFTATNPDARVTDMPDENYVSYGWWIHKSADGSTFTASAFYDVKGRVLNASGLNALNGTATYVGGAAGKYALSSPIGGTNDAGHFTARATLEANFTTNTDSDTTSNAVTGTIDNFIGADGEARDWTVELKGSSITNGGAMIDATTNGTAWTIGGTAASDSGEWEGQLYNNGDDGVPQAAAGNFYSEFGRDGKMVGGFGVNLEN